MISLNNILKDILLEKNMSYEEALSVFGLKSGHGKSSKDLQSLYRNLAKKYHPDRGGDIEKMKDVATAWEVLKKSVSSTTLDLQDVNDRHKNLGFALRDEIVRKFNERAFIKHFEKIFGKKFKLTVKALYPEDKSKTSKYGNFNPYYKVQFVSDDSEVYFNMDISTQTYNIKSKGLSSGD